MRNLLVLLIACQAPRLHSVAVTQDHETNLGAIDTHFANAMLASYSRHAREATAPLSLTPTDGSELALTALKADIAIEGPLAHTELHMTFHNAEARQREGRFQITLPPDAVIGRFAMLVDGTWRESRVLAREQGQQMFESYLKRRVDPALLERDHGNGFSARIFPIPANGDKHIIIAYDHHVSNAAPYELALRGLPKTPKLALDILEDGRATTRTLDGQVPEDVIVATEAGNVGVAARDVFVARVELGTSAVKMPLDRVVILVDTSASRVGVMASQTAVLEQVLARLSDAAMVTIAAYDQDVTELYRGPARAAHGVGIALQKHGALGASDLGRALSVAAIGDASRVILIGDGTPTLGEHRPAELAKWMTGIVRVDAIQVGQSIDRDTLAPIVAAGLNPGAILDARHLGGLTAIVEPDQRITVPGALHAWPATTHGLAPGEPVFVVGMRTATLAPLEIHIGSQIAWVTPVAATFEHVDRAVAIAQVASLEARVATASDADRPGLMHELERLGIEHDLVTSATSMIVLENDDEERRQFGGTVNATTPAAPTSPSPPSSSSVEVTASSSRSDHGEVIVVHAAAPIIDQGSTKTGITLSDSYERNIPTPTRMFESTVAAPTTITGTSQISDAGGPEWIVDQLTQSAMRDKAPRPQPPTPSTPPVYAPAPAIDQEPQYQLPYSGEMADVMTALARRDRTHAFAVASAWQLENPGDVAALIGLGEALEARGSLVLAERAYTSIIDLYPDRTELVRAAGERLDRIASASGSEGARTLAVDAYRRAIRERPDQVSTYRLLAYDLMRAHDREALDVIVLASQRTILHASVKQILEQDRATIAAYLDHKPHPASVRFVLSWETDGNDVDLHVHDRAGNHAWFRHLAMDSGGALLEDITDGYGPEMFGVSDPHAFPYKLGVHYFARGPEGVGLGSVQIIREDGRGNLTVEDRPFMIQNDSAFVDLGTVTQ